MNPDDVYKRGPGVLSVATAGGIQDVSPFLPLLSTEHCERLVTSALQRGLLYAAATPMTIFGSLGILKAGIITLWSSIDTRLFSGPTLLKDAGFVPSGHGTLLLHVAESKRNSMYVAEDKLRSILLKKRIRAVKINLLSRDLVKWNIRLLLWTVGLSSLGLIPYVYPITRGLPDEPYETTWIYPMMRIAGCDMIAVTIQFLFQLRILEETYCRIRFLATDSYLKDHGKSLPAFWDYSERSRDVLLKFRSWLKQKARHEGGAGPEEESGDRVVDKDIPRNMVDTLLNGLGKMTSFTFPLHPGRRESSVPDPVNEPTPPATPQPPPSAHLLPVDMDPSSAEKGESRSFITVGASTHLTEPPGTYGDGIGGLDELGGDPFLAWVTRGFTTLLLWATQLFLVVGVMLTVVGYIGCFSIIQANDRSNWRAPVAWLGCEVVLGIARMALWAWNPTWDDAKSPIALEKLPSKGVEWGEESPGGGGDEDMHGEGVGGSGGGPRAPTYPPGPSEKDTKKCSYGIGWMLDSVTADDMHALIIAVDKANAKGLEDLTECCADGERVAGYLEDTLLVPRSQIVKLYNEEATKEKIVGELKALAHRGTVAQDAPIVIYFAGHSFVSEGDHSSTYLVPYRSPAEKDDDLECSSIPHRDIVDLLQHIGQEKTDTITLILDCCHAGAMGQNDKFDKKQKAPLHEKTRSERGKESMDALKTDDSLGRSARQDKAKRPAGNKKRRNQEILIGHSSHILLAGSRADQAAMEDERQGGRFTRFLLEVLGGYAPLETLTYKKLVDEINQRLKATGGRRGQKAICTTIYQERLLFNGLFTRKLDEDSSMPVITVQYSDH